MQPHPHSSARDGDAWTSSSAKSKKRAKKATAKKKLVKKSATKKTTAKKPAKAKAGAKKKPHEGAAHASIAGLVGRLADEDIARQVIAALSARNRRDGDELADAATTAALQRELADSRRKLADLEQKLADLSKVVAELAAARLDPALDMASEVEEDPHLRWLGDPSIEPYVGQHVALHAARGVVAHGDSLQAVIASVRAQGLSLDDVCLATVPALPF